MEYYTSVTLMLLLFHLHSLAVEVVTVEERAEKPEDFSVHFSTEPSPVSSQLVVSVGREVIADHLLSPIGT